MPDSRLLIVKGLPNESPKRSPLKDFSVFRVLSCGKSLLGETLLGDLASVLEPRGWEACIGPGPGANWSSKSTTRVISQGKLGVPRSQ